MYVNKWKKPKTNRTYEKIGTGDCFRSIGQSAGISKKIHNQSFYGLMNEALAKKRLL